VLTIVAVIIGILAAIMPARRAAKLDPLKAIAYE
jgi:ABC-type antimicrobial peptide transport system permease subunit